MTLIGRIGLYMIGLAIGILLVLFFFGDRKIPFYYLPEARVKRNINKKILIYTPYFKNQMDILKLDSSQVQAILKDGDILFSKSQPRKKPCGIYNFEKDSLKLIIENCDSTAIPLSIAPLFPPLN